MASAQKVFLVGRSGIREGKCETMIFPLQQSKERLGKGGGREIRLRCESQYKELLGGKRLKQRRMGWGRGGGFSFLRPFCSGAQRCGLPAKGGGGLFLII